MFELRINMAGIGVWCFGRRWWVLAGWIALMGLGLLAAGPVVDSLVNAETPNQVESIRAHNVLDAASGTSGQVVGLVDRVDANAPGVSGAVDRTVAALTARADVRQVGTPFAGADPGMSYRSADGNAFLIVVTLTLLDQKGRTTAIDAVTNRLHALSGELRHAGQPQARVRVGGDPTVGRAAALAEDEDLGLGEEVSLPLTLVVLVIIFGGLVAAGLPVLGALVSIATAMVLLFGFGTVTTLDTNVLTVVTLLGLGLSIDYGLLLVSRYREELRAGRAPNEAVGRAWETAGRTIFFSALTVAVAVSGLLTFDLPGLSALGAAGISIALVAMFVALTFTAALLGFGQRWIRPYRRRWFGGGREGGVGETTAKGERGFFARVARFVQRRPVTVMVAATAVLLVAGAPALGTSAMLPGLAQLPRSIEPVQVADELASRFGQMPIPVVVIVARTSPAALDDWAARWTPDRAVASVSPAKQITPGLSLVELQVSTGTRASNVAASAQSAAAQGLVHRVRADRPPGTASWVTGDAAELVDLKGVVAQGLPWAVGVAMLAMLLLMLAMTGSLVVPVKAILASVVSLGATLGVMNLIFVRGWLSGPLHTLTVPGFDPFVTVIIVAFAFGLSMDYEVFLLGRIKEYVDAGLETDEAVRLGLQSTGQVITSAAFVMMIVFACFGGARVGSIEELGIGLTVAVLIDATVVRCLLVPATMTLLGRWNWWAPALLRNLPSRTLSAESPV